MFFNTQYKKFKLITMLFRLHNVPRRFQSTMKNIFRLYIDKFAIVYLNDIIIYSKKKEKYLEYIEKILESLSNHQLYIKLSK